MEAESQDKHVSQYGVGWKFLLGFVLEVGGSSSGTHRHEPVLYGLRCRSNDCNDQETAASATETSEAEKKKAAGWNGC